MHSSRNAQITGRLGTFANSSSSREADAREGLVLLAQVLDGLHEEEGCCPGACVVSRETCRVCRRLAVFARAELHREAAGRALVVPAQALLNWGQHQG